MILRYAQLSRHPAVFLRMTGLRVPAFDTLVADLLLGYAASEQARLQRPTRQRASGAGHPFALRPRDQGGRWGHERDVALVHGHRHRGRDLQRALQAW